MKSLNEILNEGLFDSDLVKKDLPYEKLLKYLKKKPNFSELAYWCSGLGDGDFDKVSNQLIVNWSEEMYKKYCFGRHSKSPGCLGMYDHTTWDDRDNEAKNWLKFGEIHTGFSYNDQMYANSFEIPWSFWASYGPKEDLYEWIIISQKPAWIMVVANRKSYDEFDQKLIHALIESIHKYYKKGTR
jgi:hypothetical protein